MHTYDPNLAAYISRKGWDRQQFLDAFPFQKEEPKPKPVTCKHGYRAPSGLCESEIAELCDMYRKGVPIKGIAERFDMRIESVNKVLNAANVSRTRKQTRRIDHERATSLLMAGVKYAKVAELLGCSEHAMRMRWRELIERGMIREGK